MPTTNVINTTSLKVFTGATPTAIAHANDATLTITHEPRDISTKDSAGWVELLEGMRAWEISVSGLYAYSDTNGADALFTSLNNRTTVTVAFTTNVTGDKVYSGTAYISSLDFGSPGQEDNATYSTQFKGTGAIVQTTKA